ncbi:response regulator [candidate division KSB1 bacterium]|nr:response regulator [candidate division KSB1 bacterium]
MNASILMVEDEKSVRDAYSEYLKQAGYTIKAVGTLAKARQEIARHSFHAIFLDLVLPDGNGIDWIAEVKKKNPDVVVVVITGHGDIPKAVRAMHRGADHFMAKPVKLANLDKYLATKLTAKQGNKKIKARSRSSETFYFGESEAGVKLREMAELATKHLSPVLLQGETGTGKGLLAKWIHERTFSQSAPFVEINCSGLKSELLASELFGHKKGAFTSATEDKKGLIEIAHGGTLFLDEIVNMNRDLQSEFLKVLEDKQFRPLGEVEMKHSDFRLVCASNQEMERVVTGKSFREDLYYRINIFPIQLPPLRQRKKDIPGLVDFFLKQLNPNNLSIDKEVIDLLENHDWPGNIRELRNQLERALLVAGANQLKKEHFAFLQQQRVSPGNEKDLERVEKEHIHRVLKACGGDKARAASELGISLATLYRKLK